MHLEDCDIPLSEPTAELALASEGFQKHGSFEKSDPESLRSPWCSSASRLASGSSSTAKLGPRGCGFKTMAECQGFNANTLSNWQLRVSGFAGRRVLSRVVEMLIRPRRILHVGSVLAEAPARRTAAAAALVREDPAEVACDRGRPLHGLKGCRCRSL